MVPCTYVAHTIQGHVGGITTSTDQRSIISAGLKVFLKQSLHCLDIYNFFFNL